MSDYNVLLIEDDPVLGFATKYFLSKHDYSVVHCSNAETAWRKFMKSNFDICIIDVMLPGQSGLELIKLIRKKNNIVPIIIISSNSTDNDRILGMKCGADCYLSKPYNYDELRLRMQVFLRKKMQNGDVCRDSFIIGNYIFHFNEMRLIIPEINHEIPLTQRESVLLQYLCNHSGQVVKKEQILIDIWGKNDYFLGRSLDVFINKIRKHFKNQPSVELKTIHGVGYKFNFTTKTGTIAAENTEHFYGVQTEISNQFLPDTL